MRKALSLLVVFGVTAALVSCGAQRAHAQAGGWLVDNRTTIVTNNVGSGTSLVYSTAAMLPQPPEWQIPDPSSNITYVIDTSNVCLYAVATNLGGSTTVVKPNIWNFANSSGNSLVIPSANNWTVKVNGVNYPVKNVDFRRIIGYGRDDISDERFNSYLTLQTDGPIADGDNVVVTQPSGVYNSNVPNAWNTTVTSNRFSPWFHLNQIGFHPNFPKQFELGWYQGTNLGENSFGATTFYVYDVDGASNVFSGTTALAVDTGFNGTVKPAQKVQVGHFDSVNKEGHYYIWAPNKGRSAEFCIDRNMPLCTARLIEIGLFNQRCGYAPGPPYSSWSHLICHTNATLMQTNSGMLHVNDVVTEDATVAASPWNAAGVAATYHSSNSVISLGGWHDAGDYSKYTINEAHTVAELACALNFPGVANLDNLGIPESGDGKSDIAQEAKWGADFLLKLQAPDGGFYDLVYPSTTTYENNDPAQNMVQVFYPESTKSTAMCIGALAEMSSSPIFKTQYPVQATNYFNAATNGWRYLTNQVISVGYTNSYHQPHFYGSDYQHGDEITYAGCALWAATGTGGYIDFITNQVTVSGSKITTLTGSSLRRPWTWWYNYEAFGAAQRAIAFAVPSGRRTNADMLTYSNWCWSATNELIQAGIAELDRSTNSAYATPFDSNSKAGNTVPYYFGPQRIACCIYAYELQRFFGLTINTNFLPAVVRAVDFDLGNNPGNMSLVYGVGQKQKHISPSQWQRFQSPVRKSGPTGWIFGSLVEQCNGTYITVQNGGSWPHFNSGGIDVSYPLYDRDELDGYSYSTAEATIIQQGHAVSTYAWLAVQALNYTNAQPTIVFTPAPTNGAACTLTALTPGVDNSMATIIWEQPPNIGPQTTRQQTWSPTSTGSKTWTVEVQMPDGSMYSTTTNITVN